ncbi:MAG TPA: helix-turn-helix transcriptional regulator [Ktedonobacteraceae bacterium]|nr:helix-turn-helix transcriptional regulator [Ktedonobacteraceae bacterium]
MLKLKVKEIALAKGYNQSSLSRAADIPIQTIRRIWRDPYYEVRLKTLNKIAAVLNIPATDLFEDIPE